MYDTISVRGLKVHCLIGIYPHERAEKQPLVLTCDLHLARKPGEMGRSLEESVDYSEVAGLIAFILQAGEFRLLETAVEAVCHVLLGLQLSNNRAALVEAVTLNMSKPNALAGIAIPAVTVQRSRHELTFLQERNEFGLVDILHQNRDCGIYRLRIPAHGGIPAHVHRVMGEAELVMSRGLLLQGKPIAPGAGHFWPLNFAHAYSNPTTEEQSILCVNRPVFMPEDEIAAGRDSRLLDTAPYRRWYFGLVDDAGAALSATFQQL